ncbi:hypothetical protein D1007_21375 [Hordeum vulgare]|nr:hypothetical protein D1007_21375 [Hordeum vulgare]
MNPSGCNYDDKVSISQGLFQGKGKKGDKKKKGKPFTLHHCWSDLENEKLKNRDLYEIPNKRKAVAVDEDDENDGSGEDNVAKPKTKRPDGRKKEKCSKLGDNDLKDGFEAIVNARKEYAGEKKMLNSQEIEERNAAEGRKIAADERRDPVEERR